MATLNSKQDIPFQIQKQFRDVTISRRSMHLFLTLDLSLLYLRVLDYTFEASNWVIKRFHLSISASQTAV